MFWIKFVFSLNILCLILFNDIAQIQNCEASDREAKEHATPFNKGWKGETFHMPGASALIFLLAQNLFCTIYPFCQEVKCTIQTSFGKRFQQLLPSTPLSRGLHDATPSFVKRFLFWDAPLLSRGCFMGIIPTKGVVHSISECYPGETIEPFMSLHPGADCIDPRVILQALLQNFFLVIKNDIDAFVVAKLLLASTPTMLPGEVDGGWGKLEFLQLCPGLLLPVCAAAIHRMHITHIVMELPKRTFIFPAGPPCWLLLLVELELVPLPSPLVPQGHQLSFLFPFVVASGKAPAQERFFFSTFQGILLALPLSLPRPCFFLLLFFFFFFFHLFLSFFSSSLSGLLLLLLFLAPFGKGFVFGAAAGAASAAGTVGAAFSCCRSLCCLGFCVSLEGFLPYPVCDFFLGFAHPKPPVCHGPAFWQGVARNHPFAKRSNFSGLTTLLTRGWAAYLFEAKTAAEQKLFSILFVSLFKNLCLETLKPFWGTLAPPKKIWILGTLPSPGAATFLQWPSVWSAQASPLVKGFQLPALWTRGWRQKPPLWKRGIFKVASFGQEVPPLWTRGSIPLTKEWRKVP